MIKALQGKTHQVYTGVTLVFLERADGKFAVRKKKLFSEETDVTGRKAGIFFYRSCSVKISSMKNWIV